MLVAIFLGIIAGIFSDRFGVKKVTTVGLVIMAVGLCYRPFAVNYITMFASMLLAGFGITFININMSKIIGGWYPLEKVGPMMGLTMVGCTLGITLGTGTTALLPSVSFAFALSAGLSVITLVLWAIFMKDGPLFASGAGSSSETATVSAGKSLVVALKSKNVILVGVCLMCIMGTNVALTSFLPTALQSRGISEVVAGYLTSILTLGNMFGSLLGTVAVAKIGRMKPCLVILALIVAVCTAVGWWAPVPLAAICFALIGLSFGTLVPTFMSFPALLPEVGPLYAGSAGGVIATLELIGAVVIPTYIITPLAGQNFTFYYIMAGAVMVLMAVAALFLPELLKKKTEDK